MTSKHSPTNLFRETNFEEINANLFCPRRNKKHDVIWSLSFALHDVIRGKEAVWSWNYWAIVLHWERLCSFFFKAYWGDWFSKTNSFLCGSMAWIQTILKLEEKKRLLCMYFNAFLQPRLKIKMRNSRNRRKFEFFTGYFWEDKIKLCIMTACMFSALRKQHVCNLKKNCNSNIFTRNCWKTTHRWSWMIL